jgi:hypothetical protein
MRANTGLFLLLSAFLVFATFLSFVNPSFAKVNVTPVPQEMRTDRFAVTINGKSAWFSKAAANYYFINFDLQGKAKISITAPTDDYWQKGVEVQPWRWGIRPEVRGRTITFTINKPAKLSITRPNDHLVGAEMLFIFANSLEQNVPKEGTPGVRYYKPGVYHESIDAHDGDNIYLAPGAVIFGSLNVWQVKNVKVFGRGVIVYDGPQDPNADEGWMHKKNWHCIVMDNASNIEVDGLTCVVRSRTWMIQMKDSHHIVYDNIKVIGGRESNANQDGMDWLGSGDGVVRDSFFRAADDVVAMLGNWDGYTQEAMTTPGKDVENIVVENSVLSTSISNIVRLGWPQKIFDSRGFTLRDSDVIHMGVGSCGLPFALFEVWEANNGKGSHTGYHFDNLRLEDWTSLVQIDQMNPKMRDVTFSNIWAIENPALMPSSLAGDVAGVKFANVKLPGLVSSDGDVPLTVGKGAEEPSYAASASGLSAAFTYSAGALAPRQKITFDASASHVASGKIQSYEWLFGDGTSGKGKIVHHKFPDAEGTLRDGSGRFRVLLKVTDDQGNVDWAYEPVVVSTAPIPAVAETNVEPGLRYEYFQTTQNGLHVFDQLGQGRIANGLDLGVRKSDDNYGIVYDGLIKVPADGGYTFMLFGTDTYSLMIDDKTVATNPVPQANVCGDKGNAVQQASGSVVLRAGLHRIRVSMTHTQGPEVLSLKWQGPEIPLADVPAQNLFHAEQN